MTEFLIDYELEDITVDNHTRSAALYEESYLLDTDGPKFWTCWYFSGLAVLHLLFWSRLYCSWLRRIRKTALSSNIARTLLFHKMVSPCIIVIGSVLMTQRTPSGLNTGDFTGLLWNMSWIFLKKNGLFAAWALFNLRSLWTRTNEVFGQLREFNDLLRSEIRVNWGLCLYIKDVKSNWIGD